MPVPASQADVCLLAGNIFVSQNLALCSLMHNDNSNNKPLFMVKYILRRSNQMSIKFSVAQATLQLLLSLKTFSVCLFYCSDVPKSNFKSSALNISNSQLLHINFSPSPCLTCLWFLNERDHWIKLHFTLVTI